MAKNGPQDARKPRGKTIPLAWSPDEIRALRVGLGWSQLRLAQHIGTSQPHVSAWERGKWVPSAPMRSLLMLLARKLPASLSELAPVTADSWEVRQARLAAKLEQRDLQAELFELFKRVERDPAI